MAEVCWQCWGGSGDGGKLCVGDLGAEGESRVERESEEVDGEERAGGGRSCVGGRG